MMYLGVPPILCPPTASVYVALAVAVCDRVCARDSLSAFAIVGCAIRLFQVYAVPLWRAAAVIPCEQRILVRLL